MNPRDRLQYALYLKRLQELFVIKENIAFEYQHANYNQAAAQIDKAVDKMLQNNVVNIVDGTTSLEKPNLGHVITEALSKQQNMLIKTPDRYVRSAVEQNTKHYTDILQSRIEKENYSLQRKIEEEYRKKKYNNLSEAEAKKLITEKFQDHGRRRAKNIVKDALHTNQSHMSWVSNRENYKYKVWMNGQGKGKVRNWHIASKIDPVEIDDFFDIFSPKGHAQMMYPGDMNGGAENVANCRCWLRYTNIAPSNLKKKGTIQVNPNVNLENENATSFSANTETKSKGRNSRVSESTSSNKKEGLFTKIKDKISNHWGKLKTKYNSHSFTFYELNSSNNEHVPFKKLSKNKIPQDLPKLIKKELQNFDRYYYLQYSKGGTIEYGYLTNLTTGETTGYVEGVTNSISFKNKRLILNEGDEVITAHSHLGLSPFNYKDIKEALKIPNTKYLIVHTPQDIFIAEFNENSYENKKEIIDQFEQNHINMMSRNLRFKSDVLGAEILWDNYLKDETLNKYIEFRRISK